MSIFKKATTDDTSLPERIASQILERPDRIETIFSIYEKLPAGLVAWQNNMFKMQKQTKGYVEIDIFQSVNLTLDVLPADIILKKNRDPKIGDLVEICLRDEDDYSVSTVKVMKIELKEGSLYVQNVIDSSSKGSIYIGNVLCVIETVKYSDPQWLQICKLLNIEYDLDELIKCVENSIEYVEKEEFYDKENTLKKLQKRLLDLKNDLSDSR